MRSKPPKSGAPLTIRENEVKALVAEGLSNKQIADRLEISGHTVKFHVTQVCIKLGVTTRSGVTAAHVFAEAYRKGYEDGRDDASVNCKRGKARCDGVR